MIARMLIDFELPDDVTDEQAEKMLEASVSIHTPHGAEWLDTEYELHVDEDATLAAQEKTLKEALRQIAAQQESLKEGLRQVDVRREALTDALRKVDTAQQKALITSGRRFEVVARRLPDEG